MAKLHPTGAPDPSSASSLPKRETVENKPTETTPENEKGGTLEGPNVVTALLLYGTDSLSLLPKTVKYITIGSDAVCGIVIDSPQVSRQHCRLERQDRKGELLRLVDLQSKNGTFFEGERERRFYLKPGKTFIVGARPHCFLALNDQMRQHYPALMDILGAEHEHRIGGAGREHPSPSDVIVAAAGGAPMLIASEPECEQHRLARIVHEISRWRERGLVERTPENLPTDRKVQLELIKQDAARSTFVLDLGKGTAPLDPTFVSTLFKPRYQVRVVVLARSRDVAYKVLGRSHAEQLETILLRPLVQRSEAIDRLFDRMLEERGSPLRMSYLTPENQEALRDHDWPANFASLRKAAAWLTAIYRLGTINKAAHALEQTPSTMYTWYSHTLKLSDPLSRRLIRRGKDG